MVLLDLARVRAIMTEVVAENGGDTERIECRYATEGGEPDCIVGHVFAKAGVDMNLFTESQANHQALCSALVVGIAREGGVTLTQAARDYLSEAQRVQDGNAYGEDGEQIPRAWGTALDVVEEAVAAGVWKHTEDGEPSDLLTPFGGK